MLNFRSNYPSAISPLLFTFLLVFPLISVTSLTQYSHGDFHQNTQIPDDREFRGGGVHYTKRRILDAEDNDNNNNNNNTTWKSSTGGVLILAAERTHRKDPSDNFKYYTGGWNITNSHYLLSVGFSSAPPFIAAVLWFLLFGLYLIFIFIRHCCCNCCRSREAIGCSRVAFVMSLGFLILFTVATIAGSVVAYVGQQKFQTNIVRVTSFVLHQADNAFNNLRTLLNNLLAAKSIGVEQLTLPPEIQAQIDQIGVTVNTLADNFHSVSANSTQEIRSFLKPMRLSLIYVAVALLTLAIIGFVISILGWKCLVYCLVIICWILVTATLIISGMFLLVHNAVEDTCVAMDEWLQNPTANSALENIIPKVDNETAQQIFSVSKGVTYGVVQVIDGTIANISNANNIPPNAGPIYYNQSGPLMPILCNPYYSNLTQRQCAPGDVDFQNASEVWSSYVCQVSESGICNTPGRVTPTGYANIITSTNVSYALYEQSPFLVDLIDSTYIKQTFDRISRIYCPGLSRYSQWTYVGFVSASVGIILSLMLWICNIKGGSTRACAGHF